MQNINLSQTEREGIKSLLHTGVSENIELARCFLSGQNISEPDFMREEFPEIWILSERIRDWATLDFFTATEFNLDWAWHKFTCIHHTYKKQFQALKPVMVGYERYSFVCFFCKFVASVCNIKSAKKIRLPIRTEHFADFDPLKAKRPDIYFC